MSGKTVVHADEAARRLIYGCPGESLERIEAEATRIRTMCLGVNALLEEAPRDVSQTAVPAELCDRPGFTYAQQLLSAIAARSDELWGDIDGDFSNLRSPLDTCNAIEHEEAANG